MQLRLSLALALIALTAQVGCSTYQNVKPDTESHNRVFTPSFDSPELDEKLTLDPDIATGVLPNGLTYFVEQNSEPEARVELRLIVRVGSVFEDDDQRGLAHFIEHMAFNSTEHFEGTELVSFLESVGTRFGAHLNAYTSFNETVYMLQLPTDDEALLDKGFLVLHDWAQGQKFSPGEIDKERGVVLEELRVRHGAQMRIFEQSAPLIYGERYGSRLPVGTEASLKGFTHEALKRFYTDWYRPDLMAVAVVGDIDVEAMLEKIKHDFGDLTSPATPRPREDFRIPDHSDTKILSLVDVELTTPTVTVLWKSDFLWGDSRRDYVRALVRDLFAAMVNERMSQVARQVNPPFLRAMGFQQVLNRNEQAYRFMAQVKPDGAETGLEALLTELRRIKLHGFTPDELERARSRSLKSIEKWYNEREKTDSRIAAGEIARHFTVDELAPGIDAEYAMEKKYIPMITLEDVNQYVSGWMVQGNRVILAALPDKEDVARLTERQIQELVARIDSLQVEPPKEEETVDKLMEVAPRPGSVVETSEDDALGITEWKLSNGIRVILKPTDFKNDEIRFGAWSLGGYSLVSDEDYIAARTAIELTVESGAGPVNRTQLDRFLAGKTVSVRAQLSDLYEGIRGVASPKDQETMFQLVHLYLTAPRFDNDAFSRVLEKHKTRLDNRESNPEAMVRDEHMRQLYQDHLRRRPWTVETLDAMSLETSSDVYLDRFADLSDLTFVFVGNVDMETFRPLVETYLASLPGTGAGETWRDVGVTYPPESVSTVVKKGIEPKGRVWLSFYGDAVYSREEAHLLTSMASALQIRAREVIREDMSGTYGVGIRASMKRWPKEQYQVDMMFACDPERVDELTEALLAEIARIKETGIDQEYLDRVTKQQLRTFETNLRENRYWLKQLERSYRYGDDPHLILEYEALVGKINAKAIRGAARKYLDTSRMVKTVLLPAEEPTE